MLFEFHFFLVELLQEGKSNIKRTVKPGMDLVNVKLSLDDIYLMLNSVNDYVDKVHVSFHYKLSYDLVS
jgi:hypothetical protein